MILLTEECLVKYLNTEVLNIEVNRFFEKERKSNDKMCTKVF